MKEKSNKLGKFKSRIKKSKTVFKVIDEIKKDIKENETSSLFHLLMTVEDSELESFLNCINEAEESN